MSLTSLADAPLLSKPLAAAGLLCPNPRPRSSSKLKENQAAIDALFEEDSDMQMDKTFGERKCHLFSKELSSSATNLDSKSNTGNTDIQKSHVASFPTLLPLTQQSGDIFKKKDPKQDDSLFSKTRDANDVLAGFLADSTSAVSASRPIKLEAQKDQREEFKSKWNSYSPQPATRLPTITSSPLLSSDSTNYLTDSLGPCVPPEKLASNLSNLSKKDGDWSMKDVLSLLPDESNKSSEGVNLRVSPSTSSQGLEEESSDFGGYQPSCLSMPAATHVMQRRPLPNFLSLSERSDLKEKTTAVHQDGGPCNKKESDLVDLGRRNPLPVKQTAAENFTVETIRDEKPEFLVEIQRLRDENLALKEEIMKIEADKLRIAKEFLEKELKCEPERANQADSEREEAQKIAEDLALELLSVKQSLSLTEEKIDCMKKVHEHEIEMLKSMHKKELEMKDRQMCMEETFLAEKSNAMEALSQLLSKADGWSSRIDELHKSIVHEEISRPLEKSTWIANIESMVSDHESSLQMLEKRSTEVCNQLEKVAIMLDNARKDMESLQKQEEERMNKTHNQLQAFQDIIQKEHEQTLASKTNSEERPDQILSSCEQEQQMLLTSFLKFEMSQEKKDLEVEREKILFMKEQLLQAEATLRKQLHEHAVCMQAEVEEMARQKKELEHAKNIAAEIALEVESSGRELDVYKVGFNRTAPKYEEKSLTDNLPAQKISNFERNLELIRRRKLHQRPYTSADVYRNVSFGLNLLDNFKMFRSGSAVLQDVEEDTCYLRSQEDFLIQAEKVLEGMPLNEVCAS